jgi:Flagellar basal body-associated protein
VSRRNGKAGPAGRTAGQGSSAAMFAAIFVAAALGGGGVAGYYKYHSSSTGSAGVAPAAAVETAAEAATTLVRIDNLMANLSPGSRARMVRVSVVVPLNPAASTRPIEGVEDALREAFLTHLRALEAGDLEGAQAIQRLKDSLLARARDVVGRNAVKEVLIRDFVVN